MEQNAVKNLEKQEIKKITLPNKQDLDKHSLIIAVKKNERLWIYSNLEEIPVGPIVGNRVNLYLKKDIPEGKYYFYVDEAPLTLTKDKDGNVLFETLWNKDASQPGVISKTLLKFEYIFTDCRNGNEIRSVHPETCVKILSNIKEYHEKNDPIFEEAWAKILAKGVSPDVLDFLFKKKIANPAKIKEAVFLSEKIQNISSTGIAGINSIPKIFKDKNYQAIRHFVMILSLQNLIKNSDAEMIYSCLLQGKTKFAWFVEGMPSYFNANKERSEFAYALGEALHFGSWKNEGPEIRKIHKTEGTLSENPELADLKNKLEGRTSR